MSLAPSMPEFNLIAQDVFAPFLVRHYAELLRAYAAGLEASARTESGAGDYHGHAEMLESFDKTAGGAQFSVVCGCGYETPERTDEEEAWRLYNMHDDEARERDALIESVRAKAAGAERVAAQMIAWQAESPDRVKVPD